MFSNPRVLLCVCDAGQKASLRRSLEAHAELSWACTAEEISQQLEHNRYDAVLCARAFCSGGWNQVVQQVRQLSPELPVIILSQTADKREWAEVLAAGAFDLLAQPCYDRTLLTVMEHAVVSREARAWYAAPSLPAA